MYTTSEQGFGGLVNPTLYCLRSCTAQNAYNASCTQRLNKALVALGTPPSIACIYAPLVTQDVNVVKVTAVHMYCKWGGMVRDMYTANERRRHFRE